MQVVRGELEVELLAVGSVSAVDLPCLAVIVPLDLPPALETQPTQGGLDAGALVRRGLVVVGPRGAGRQDRGYADEKSHVKRSKEHGRILRSKPWKYDGGARESLRHHVGAPDDSKGTGALVRHSRSVFASAPQAMSLGAERPGRLHLRAAIRLGNRA